MAVKGTHIGKDIRVDYGGCYYRGVNRDFWECLILPGGVTEGSTKGRNSRAWIGNNPRNNGKYLVLTLLGTIPNTVCV